MRPGPIVSRWAGLIRVEQAWAVPELVKGVAHGRRCRTIELMAGSQGGDISCREEASGQRTACAEPRCVRPGSARRCSPGCRCLDPNGWVKWWSTKIAEGLRKFEGDDMHESLASKDW